MNVDLNVRICYKTASGPIEALTQEFTLTIKGDELTTTENDCADAIVDDLTVEKSGDKTLSFKQWTDEESQEVTIYGAVKAKSI
jgi:hypothetical protein